MQGFVAGVNAALKILGHELGLVSAEQLAAVEEKYAAVTREQKRLEERTLPADADYLSIAGLRIEARQKLDKIRPLNLGQASRISGVSPADMAVLMVWLKQQEDNK